MELNKLDKIHSYIIIEENFYHFQLNNNRQVDLSANFPYSNNCNCCPSFSTINSNDTRKRKFKILFSLVTR